jgi:hypothetical protein
MKKAEVQGTHWEGCVFQHPDCAFELWLKKYPEASRRQAFWAGVRWEAPYSSRRCMETTCGTDGYHHESIHKGGRIDD